MSNPTTTPAFQLARNAKTSLYEVHAHGCTHLTFLDDAHDIDGTNGPEAAQTYADQNDGLIIKLGPCVKGPRGVLYQGPEF